MLAGMARKSRAQVNITGADYELWRELRIEALRRDVSPAELWNTIVREWLAANVTAAASRAPPPKHSAEVNPNV